MEIQPISYNEFMQQFGGTYENFAMRSLAYMLQQQKDTLDQKTTAQWEAKLINIDVLTGRSNNEQDN